MSAERIGHCLCKAVTVTASPKTAVGACHCTSCRAWCGGPFLAVDCGTDVKIEGAEFVNAFDSSSWAERASCSRCGSKLFYRLKGNNTHIVSAGLFGMGDDFELDHQIFIDEKPPWYDFANETDNKTGAEVFASVAAESE